MVVAEAVVADSTEKKKKKHKKQKVEKDKEPSPWNLWDNQVDRYIRGSH